MQFNLIANLAQERSEPSRKLDINAAENIHLIKLSEDLKNFNKSKYTLILVDITSDSDMR